MHCPPIALIHTTLCCLCWYLLLQVGQCYTILSRPEGSLAAGKIANILKFKVKEIDPTTGEAEEDGYEDEYQVRAGKWVQGLGRGGAGDRVSRHSRLGCGAVCDWGQANILKFQMKK